ncbi:hypothetical protein [Agromyces sp. ZXT2-3]|uniref:hypothetical protein n=1 Tax=Agromyces sp. ZXT2-3 TaxID=3461152 RepID=UPI004054A147
MPSPRVTIRSLALEPGDGGVGDEIARIAAERDVGGAVAKVVTRMAAAGGDYVAGEVGRVADGLLDLDVTDVVAHAWDRHRAVTEAKEWSAKNPDGEMVVPLVTHTVKWSYEPAVEVSVDAIAVTSIALAVGLDTTVKGAIIAFRRGEVADVRTGTVEVRAKVECEGVKLAERSGTFGLPALLGFSGAPPVQAPAPVQRPEPAYRPGDIVNGHRLNADATAWLPVDRYRPGDVVNGHRLDPTGTTWVPIARR